MSEGLSYSKEQLGSFLKQTREQQRCSLRELGRLSGISGSHIYRMESAQFDCMLETFIKLTVALGIPPGWAIDRALGCPPNTFKKASSHDRIIRRLCRRLQARHYGTFVIESFIEGLCAATLHLLRSGNPILTLNYLEMDEELRAWFVDFAQGLSVSTAFLNRVEITRALLSHGLEEVIRLRICSEAKIVRHLKGFVERANKWPSSGTPEELSKRLLSKATAVPVFYPAPPGSFNKLPAQKTLEYNDKHLQSREVSSIPPTIAHLISRIRSATKPRGARAKLARTLGVLPQQVNDWLKGRNTPGGEATLQLLKWVEAGEVKLQQPKNDPGRALTRPGRVTRKRKITSNEKPKSGRQ